MKKARCAEERVKYVVDVFMINDIMTKKETQKEQRNVGGHTTKSRQF